MDSRIHTTSKTFPATVRFIPGFGGSIENKIFCVETNGQPEILWLVEEDIRASNIYPFEAGRFGPPTQFGPSTFPGGFVTLDQQEFDLDTETLVTRPHDFQFIGFGSMTFFSVPETPPLSVKFTFVNVIDATMRNGGPLLLLNLTTKQIVARNVLERYSISWVTPTHYSGGDKIVKINTRASVGEQIITLPDDGIPPDAASGGKDWHGLPNPFTHEPWIKESSDAASTLVVQSFKETIRLHGPFGISADSIFPNIILTPGPIVDLPFSRGAFLRVPGELRQPSPLTFPALFLPDTFTTARVVTPQAFLGGDAVTPRPVIELTPGPERILNSASVPQDQVKSINEWAGTGFVRLFEWDPVGGPGVAILKVSKRWILLREGESGPFRLVDRLLKTNRVISAESVSKFDPTPTGKTWHITEDRIYFVGPREGEGLTLADRGLLRVAVDEASGEIILTKSADVGPPAEATDFLNNLRGDTSVVFPASLNGTGNPTR